MREYMYITLHQLHLKIFLKCILKYIALFVMKKKKKIVTTTHIFVSYMHLLNLKMSYESWKTFQKIYYL